MLDPSNAVSLNWARRLRSFLMVAAVVMIGLVLYKAPWGGSENYLVKSAYGGAIGAAPGFIAMTLADSAGSRSGEAKIYLVDTGKRVACVYAFRNEKLRLVSARQFDQDMGILDASDAVRSEDGRSVIKPPEGNNGFDKKTAEAYAKGQLKMMEDAEKKR
jgi:hypothetical protein